MVVSNHSVLLRSCDTARDKRVSILRKALHEQTAKHFLTWQRCVCVVTSTVTAIRSNRYNLKITVGLALHSDQSCTVVWQLVRLMVLRSDFYNL